jgi:hypothetical protein
MISISGKKGSGKDLAADYIVKQFGYTKVAFADNVKRFCSEQFGLPLHFFNNEDLKDQPLRVSFQLYSSEIVQLVEELILLENMNVGRVPWSTIPLEKNLKTPREILQFVGTDLGRNIVNKDIWIGQLQPEIAGKSDLVIADARMQNERDFLRKMGAKKILVVRHSEVNDHESENDLGNPDEYDYVLDNSGSKEDLYKLIDGILKEVK